MELEQRISNGERQLSLLGGGMCWLYAARRPSWASLALAIFGSGLVVRGLTGRPLLASLMNGGERWGDGRLLSDGLEIIESITVNCQPEEAYRFWRRLENLPRFMTHLESVQELDETQSHWVVKAPAGITIEWDAEICEEYPDELIRWQTLPSATVQHTGLVQFRPAPTGRGTEVTTMFLYDPPGGIVGEAFAQLTNSLTSQQIREEIRRFKQIMEAGEIATIDGQPSGRE